MAPREGPQRVAFPPGETVGGAAARLRCGEGALRAANAGLAGRGARVEPGPGEALAPPPPVRMAGAGSRLIVLRRGDLLVPVRRDDTLWGLQRLLGVSLSDLRPSNSGSEDLRAGELLLVKRAALLCRIEAGAPFLLNEGASPSPQRFWKGFRVSSGVGGYRTRYQSLISALRFVETSNALPAPAGGKGKSIGPLQIQDKYHEDAWQGRAHYALCEEVPHSEETVVRYWMRHVPWALVLGDLEAMSRSHNGGPQFFQAHETGWYWRKVCRAGRYTTAHAPLDKRMLVSVDLGLFRGEAAP